MVNAPASRAIWATIGALVVSATLANITIGRYRDTIGFVVDPVLVAVLIVQSLATGVRGFGALVNWRWVRYLGTISYSVKLTDTNNWGYLAGINIGLTKNVSLIVEEGFGKRTSTLAHLDYRW